jgi:hypothetical protein
MARQKYYQFRFLSVDDSVVFALQELVLALGLGLFCGAVLGVVHGALLDLLGRMTLLSRLLEALLISLWPLCVAANVGSRLEEGEQPTLGDLVSLDNFVPLLPVSLALFCIAMVGALAVNQIALWIGRGSVDSLWGYLASAPSLSGGMAAYPLFVLGGMLLGVGFSFAPFVAIHEGGGPLDVLARSRHLARELKWGMLFLHGFLFITVSFAFVLLALLPNEPTFVNRVMEASVISIAALVTGFVWNHAFGQALALEKEEGFRGDKRGEQKKRFVIG